MARRLNGEENLRHERSIHLSVVAAVARIGAVQCSGRA